MDLILNIKRLLLDERLIREQETVIIAVSGGPDSMVLLHVMSQLSDELGLKLVVAHMNHGFRPEESLREAEMVRQFADSLGIGMVYREADIPAYAAAQRMNAQAAAREVRYQFLFDTASQHRAERILLAHHRDDQVETILMRLFRGASLSGLAGMPVERTVNKVKLIRPMLRIEKDSILSYAGAHHIPYSVDSSNLSRDYDRNRLRLDVIPLLHAFNPQLPQAMTRMAEVLRGEDEYMQAQTVERYERLVELEHNCARMDRQAFMAEPLALQRRLIKLILNYLSSDFRQANYDIIESVRHSIIRESLPSAALVINAKLRFERVYDKLVWKRVDPGAPRPGEGSGYSYELLAMISRFELPEASGVMHLSAAPLPGGDRLPMDASSAIFDAAKLIWPLTIRSRRDGDRMDPLGVNGSKKVKDIFIDLKIEPAWRDRVPILVDGANKLLWIPGIRRSRHALVSASTAEVVQLCFDQVDERLS